MDLMKSVGEKKAIDYMREKYNELLYNKSKIIKGIGDDAAILKFDNDEYLVVSTDRQPTSLGFSYKITGYREIGNYAVYQNISDLAAMGAKPIGLLMAIGLPRDFVFDDFKKIINGIFEEAKYYDTPLIGGDLKQAEKLNIVGIALGVIKKGRRISRDNAKPGDVICITGPIGRMAATQFSLIEKINIINNIKEDLYNVFRPKISLKSALLICENKLANSGMDISDGLLSDIETISIESGVKCIIDIESLPIPNSVKQFSQLVNLPPECFACSLGGDWEIIFTIPKEKLNIAIDLLSESGLILFSIGFIENGKGVYLKYNEREFIINPQGWDSFKYYKFEEATRDIVYSLKKPINIIRGGRAQYIAN